MRCDVDFYVAVRGPLEQVRKLQELPWEWFGSLPEKDRTEDARSEIEMLETSLADLERLSEKDVGKDGLVIAEWDDFTYNGQTYLRFLSFINKHPACQDVETAVTARVNHSVMDSVSYHSFWGRGEDNAFNPEFDKPCTFRLHIPMTVTSRSGETLELDFLDLENAQDILLGSWRLFEMSSTDAMMAFEENVFLFLQHKKDGAWKALLCGADLEYGLGGSKELKKKVLGMPESNGVPMIYLLEAGYFRFSLPKCSKEAIQELLAVLLPEKTLCLEMRDRKPFLWDEDGNEYFLGGVVKTDMDGISSTVDWQFPDGCGWIPKSLYENC